MNRYLLFIYVICAYTILGANGNLRDRHSWVIFGNAGNNQLGNPSYNQEQFGVPYLPNQGSFASLSFGLGHTVGLDLTGNVYGWGMPQNGSLGPGVGSTPQSIPVQLNPGSPAIAVAATAFSTVYLDINGHAWIVGFLAGTIFSTWTEISNTISFAAVKCGFDHCLFVTSSTNELYGYGGNLNGQVILPVSTFASLTLIDTLTSSNILFCAGRGHTNWVSSTGPTLYGQGACDQLQVPNPACLSGVSTKYAISPAPLFAQSITELHCGLEHSVAMTIEKDVWAWGANDKQQVSAFAPGDAVPPFPVYPSGSWAHVMVAMNTTVGELITGEILGWGLGNGFPGNPPTNTSSFNNMSTNAYPRPNWLRLPQITAYAASPITPMLAIRLSEDTDCSNNRPVSAASCVSGGWISQRSMELGDSQEYQRVDLDSSSTFTVYGDFLMQSTAALTLSYRSNTGNSPIITVTGCASLNGTFTVNLTTSDISTIKAKGKSGVEFQLLSSSCSYTPSGGGTTSRDVVDVEYIVSAPTTPDVSAQPTSPVSNDSSTPQGLLLSTSTPSSSPSPSSSSSCSNTVSSTTSSSSSGSSTTLSALLSISNTCDNTWKIIVGVVVGVVGLAIVITIIVIFSVPKIRHKIMPYKGTRV